MFLKKIDINGFKSFANRTTLDFSFSEEAGTVPRVTAIVGPNGSGKSNIADAMRWVMGEQSMKNLRGKKAEDVIFAGSGKKSKLGSAQVSLFFDNSDKKIPLEFSDVVIARRVFRSGEGEYLINGSRVRLQDVVDIFAKAGVGKESHAIINQGMADAILSATPVERRYVIEEAAGVKQYQIKKDRALRKMETTRENLARVNQLIEELRPHLKTLKRQAERATQGAAVGKQLREKQLLLYGYLWNRFTREKAQLGEEKDELGRRMMNVQRDADKLVDEINKRAKEEKVNEVLTELEKIQREKRGALGMLECELIVSEGRMEIEREKQKNIRIIEEIKTRTFPVDLSYVKKNLDEIKHDQELLVQKLAAVSTVEEIRNLRDLAESIQRKLFELRGDIEKGKKETALAETKPKLSVENLPIKSEELERFKERGAKIRQEMGEIENDLRKIEKEIEAEIGLDRERRQQFFQLEREMRLKRDEVGAFKDKYNDFKVSLAKVEVREEDLRSRIKEELKMEIEQLEVVQEVGDQFSLEREIAKLKFQMEQIGGIDPLVVTEYEETDKRFAFLSHESEDLDRALVSLLEVVKEMEKKVDEKFHATFDEINKEFSKYFRIIFGGGEARLIKLKMKIRKAKDDAALEGQESQGEQAEPAEEALDEKGEIGLDIFACPPGKKISNLSLLSGGERSLTSLALLFAIIAHNPPPFSILDEVEAALDEANSRRFSRIIQELSGKTQFIIITHNRETMRQAELLYGVTMGDDGISKLLSVRIDQVGQGGKIINADKT